MILQAFCVFDEKAQVFGTPIFCATKGLAVRSFADAVAQKDSPLNIHASDFKLYRVGDFDTISGALVSLPQPEFLHTAFEFKEV